ncbi:MAG: hypothetical protein LBU51_07010 [Bacteroidales bacterium]|nr:hypothetical protein [Bacteroidales bacterium]
MCRLQRTVFSFFILLLILSATFSAQEFPVKATLSPDGTTMRIGDKDYRIYNAFDPIAPKGGERVIDYAGVLDYYMWIHKAPNGDFAVSRIDKDLNIFYYDQETQKYASPTGEVMEEKGL